MNRSGRRSWIQIPILLLLMKVFYNVAKRSEIGHVRIGIGLRISGRTFTHTSDKKVRPAHNAMMIMPCQLARGRRGERLWLEAARNLVAQWDHLQRQSSPADGWGRLRRASVPRAGLVTLSPSSGLSWKGSRANSVSTAMRRPSARLALESR